MKTQNKTILFSQYLKTFFAFALFFTTDIANSITAEYKCTQQCSMCVTFDNKKVVCSEKYSDESEKFIKAKKLSRFVNEGLITPPVALKNNFNIDSFAQQFYKCDLMVKKVELIQEATQNFCATKTADKKKVVVDYREPAAKEDVKTKEKKK
jgi:hypothetical protein